MWASTAPIRYNMLHAVFPNGPCEVKRSSPSFPRAVLDFGPGDPTGSRVFGGPMSRAVGCSGEGALCRPRNLVERFFSKRKHFRAIAARYHKLARNFLAAIALSPLGQAL